jgi:hypothetical protein
VGTSSYETHSNTGFQALHRRMSGHGTIHLRLFATHQPHAMTPLNPATVAALTDFPRQLELFFHAIPETHRLWSPPSWEGIPSEPYHALGQVCHVRDIETDGYHLRFARTLHETRPMLASLDGDAMAAQRRYDAADALQALATFRAARAKTMAMVTAFTPADLARQAVFEGYGPLTLRSLVHYLCSHDQQHLAGLQWLMGKIDASHA